MTERSEARWKRLHLRYSVDRKRRMLALDGGGIRGMITLQVLRRIEEIVGSRLCFCKSAMAAHFLETSAGVISL
jgi:patatin-like phospholipase/acyl hydrolase